MVAVASPDAVPTTATVVSAGEAAPPPRKQFPVIRFWQETISVEEDIQPEIKVVSKPRFDPEERTLSFECDKGIFDVMPTEGQAVGRRVPERRSTCLGMLPARAASHCGVSTVFSNTL